jgi:hypothetical protein
MIHCDGKPASRNIIIDDRQTANRKSNSVNSCLEGQLATTHNELAGRRGVRLATAAPCFPILAGRRSVDQRGA